MFPYSNALNSKNNNGIVSIDTIEESKTNAVADFPSPPYRVVNKAVLVAQGIESKNTRTYLTSSFIGKKQTKSIVRMLMPISLFAHVKYP